MKFIFCIILSAIGMACYSKNPIKIENGIYVNKSGSKLMEIKNDTLTLRSSSIESGQSTPLAICKIMKAGKAFFEINSVDGSVLSAFKNISITEDTQDDKISSKITFEVPNTTMPIKFNVYCGTILYISSRALKFCDNNLLSDSNKCIMAISHKHHGVATMSPNYYR